jgi:hypothetical protein
MSVKKSNDTIGNQTRDLPTYRAVPQPTAPPHASHYSVSLSLIPSLQKMLTQISSVQQDNNIFI